MTVPVTTAVSVGIEVPIWVLGSTVSGTSIAGELGLPFAVASHFASEQLDQALEVYRDAFSTEVPTARLESSRRTVSRQLDAFIARTRADELITVTFAFDPEVRERSIELLAEVWF